MTDGDRMCSVAISYADLGWAVLPYVKLPNGEIRFDEYEITKLLHRPASEDRDSRPTAPGAGGGIS